MYCTFITLIRYRLRYVENLCQIRKIVTKYEFVTIPWTMNLRHPAKLLRSIMIFHEFTVQVFQIELNKLLN